MNEQPFELKLAKLRPVSQICKALGIGSQTGVRWCLRGIKLANGETVKLKHMRAGRTLYTTEEWFDAFAAARNSSSVDEIPLRSPSERERASEQAARELASIGA